MKRQNVLKVLFYSLILTSMSSCGLIAKWKSPEQPTESESAEATSAPSSETDDLFAKTMNETNEETPLNAGADAPNNVTNTEAADVKEALKSLEDEFAGNTVAKNETKDVKVEESLPVIQEELPQASVDNANTDAGKVMSYKVQKGETLMQIAFKIYGDLSKWKSIKNMNGAKLGGNTVLQAGMELKYTAPAKNFVWNPEGNPHMIKNGETLGTISNTAYQTPKKWKSIWENNKPLIKNPNVIYAGFTLFIKASGLANYVQPKAVQKKLVAQSEDSKMEVEKLEAGSDNTQEIQAAPERQSDEMKSDDLSEIKEELKAEAE